MTTTFRPPGRWGLRYDPTRRTLAIFEPERLHVFRADPPQAWVRSSDRPGWTHIRRSSVLSLSAIARRAAKHLADGEIVRAQGYVAPERPGLDALAAFLAALDPAVLALALPFGADGWPMYCMLKRCPDAHDLARENPLLAFGLAHLNEVTAGSLSWPLRTARRLLRRKRRDIAGALLLPATEAAVRICSRAPVTEASVGLLFELSSAMKHPDAYKKLAHIQRIGYDVASLLSTEALLPYVHPQLLDDVAKRAATQQSGIAAERSVQGMLRDSTRLVAAEGGKMPIVKSYAELLLLHDHAAARATYLQKSAIPFDKPPLAGTAAIQPLDSPQALAEEAKAQVNCLAGDWFVDRVRAGDFFVYRVLAPERASLAIVREGLGEPWQIEELRAFLNGPVSPDTERAVRTWLATQQRTAHIEPAHIEPAHMTWLFDQVAF